MLDGGSRQDGGRAARVPAMLALALSMAVAAPALWSAEVSLTVAGLRVMPERWNKSANLEKFERYAREAAARGADVRRRQHPGRRRPGQRARRPRRQGPRRRARR